MFESEEPHFLVRDWLIPWYANFAIWATTVSAIVMLHTIGDTSLWRGPIPQEERVGILGLADSKTALWPMAAVALLGAITWHLSRRPLKKRKGRNAPAYLRKQFFDEFRSFALNAGSISAVASYFASSTDLVLASSLSWFLWGSLHWFWVRENAPSPLDS